ncbi:MAG TPA: 50S ribosomal protein L22 [Dehalococcoidia bacterium]|nr:50S ribosomal protein L22 [Dehalococcoidia bacterium]
MPVRASATNIRVSARKVRLLLRELPGKDIDTAMTYLRFSGKPIARTVAKVVKSAAANAENNYQLSPDELRIVRAYADEARTLKRFKARSRGRASPILRRYSHITVIVDEA